MSTQPRHPAGTPVGGQFATTAHPEADVAITTPGCSCTKHETCDPCIDAGVFDAPIHGLATPDDLDAPTRQIADALDAAGLNGTVRPVESHQPGWAYVDVDLPSGHELSVGVARHEGEDAYRKEGAITAITVALRATDRIEDEPDVNVQSFGGSYGEVAIGEQVHQALIASAARAEFDDRFPDAEANGCTLEGIGRSNAPTAWRRIEDPQPQADDARFTLPGGEVWVTVHDGDVGLEADGHPLVGIQDSYLRGLAAADVTHRLGLGATHETAVQTLGDAVTEVVAAAEERPVYAENLRLPS